MLCGIANTGTIIVICVADAHGETFHVETAPLMETFISGDGC